MRKHKKELPLRPILIRGGIIIGLFILILSFLLGSLSLSTSRQLEEGTVIRAYQKSLIAQQSPEAIDAASRAIQLAHFAYDKPDVKRIEAVKNLYDLYQTYAPLSTPGPYRPDKSPKTAFTLKDISSLHTFAYTSFADSPLRLVSLQDSTLNYWPNAVTAKKKTINLSNYMDQLLDVELGFSADGKNIQLLSHYEREPVYLINGKVINSPWLELYTATNKDTANNASPPQTTGIYLGYYNFFSQTFIDRTGNVYDYQEFLAFTKELSNLLINREDLKVEDISGQRINPDALFSCQLVNENKSLDLTVLDQLLAKPWAESIHIEKEDILSLPKDRTNRVQPIELTRKAYNAMLVWNPDSLDQMPKQVVLKGIASSYVTALSDRYMLSLSPDGELLIWDYAGNPLKSLLGRESAVVDLAVSPNHQYVVARTAKDSVYIWNHWGNRLHVYEHPQISDFDFSPDGSHLLSYSKQQLLVWSSSTYESRSYLNDPDAPSISLARFQEDNNHVIIGLDEEGKEPQIVYWLPDGQLIQFTDLPNDPLEDVGVSLDGRTAVALQNGTANFLAPSKVRKQLFPFSGMDEKIVPLRLSPDGKYIVRQSPEQGLLELYDRNGARLNAYQFRPGFEVGYQDQLFTADGQYLISERVDELWFWQAENSQIGTVIQWANPFRMTRAEKRDDQLNTFIDYLPGTKTDAKVWGTLVLLVAIFLMILYFSDFVLEFIEQKSKLESVLYLGSFLLLSLFLILLWGLGMTIPKISNIGFYGVVWTSLFLTSVWAVQSGYVQKYTNFIPLGITGSLILVGTIIFLAKENQQNKLQSDRETTRWTLALQADYQNNSSYYDGLLRSANKTVPNAPLTVKAKLSIDQIRYLAQQDQLRIGRPNIQTTNEWLSVLLGLLSVLAFVALVDQPIFRGIAAFREVERGNFYRLRWLILPACATLLCLGGILWFIFTPPSKKTSTTGYLAEATISPPITKKKTTMKQSEDYLIRGNVLMEIGAQNETPSTATTLDVASISTLPDKEIIIEAPEGAIDTISTTIDTLSTPGLLEETGTPEVPPIAENSNPTPPVTTTNPTTSTPTTSTGSVRPLLPNARRQLVKNLFAQNSTVRDAAKAELIKHSRGTPAMIDELIEENLRNTGAVEGTSHVLDLLKMQKDEWLIRKNVTLERYFRTVYTGQTRIRIQGLRARMRQSNG